jgi:hypothetical protein
MATPSLAISLTSVLSGISAATVETGVAILGAAIAALPLLLLGVTWRKVLLSFRGCGAVGTVTGIDQTGSSPGQARAQVSFRAGDGREVVAHLNVHKRTRAGDRLDIRYDPARPESATNRSARAVITRFLLPVGTLAAVGLAGVAGTLYTAAAGGFGAFSNGYAVVVLVVFGLYAFFVSYLRYAGITRQGPGMTGQTVMALPGSSAVGAVLAPTLVGAVLLAGAVVLAWN